MVKKSLILAAWFSTLGTGAFAREEISGPVTAEILRVIDGDTILVEAQPWPQQKIEVYVRIRGIDTPEMNSRCEIIRESGRSAQRALEAMTASSPRIELSRISGDKYFGRIVADVRFADGRDAANNLLLAGLARQYDGGRKPTEVCDAP
jgi:endonuclease YncB( thermonuclease family)